MTAPEIDDRDAGALEVGVRVRTHPALCNGVGNCHRWAPRVYPLDDEGRVDIHLLDVPAELAADARLGAQVCPEHAITVIEPDPRGLGRRPTTHTPR